MFAKRSFAEKISSNFGMDESEQERSSNWTRPIKQTLNTQGAVSSQDFQLHSLSTKGT